MYATLHTTEGDIRAELLPEAAPKTVANFVNLATGKQEWIDPRTGQPSTQPLYNGTKFHRVIDNFMIQGGDPLGTGTGGPGYQFDDEINPTLNFNDKYVLAMANAGKQRNPLTGKVEGTNGSQFFITTAQTPWLQGKHTIFGRVLDEDSRAVVDRINETRTDASDRPLQDIVINSVDISE